MITVLILHGAATLFTDIQTGCTGRYVICGCLAMLLQHAGVSILFLLRRDERVQSGSLAGWQRI